jgi:Peptidase family S41/Tricorn protease C1 domain
LADRTSLTLEHPPDRSSCCHRVRTRASSDLDTLPRFVTVFVRASRLITLTVLAALAAACGGDAAAPTAESMATTFDRMWMTVDRQYSYFEHKGIDWNAVRSEFRPRAERATTTFELVTVVQEALATLRDVHVWILTPDGRTVPTWRPSHRVNWSATFPAGYRQRGTWIAESPVVAHGAPEGGIPHIAIASFGNGQFDVSVFDRVLERYRDAPALILDVRMNGGGNDALALQVAGRFTTARRTVGWIQFRSGPRHDAFTALTQRTVSPRGSWQYTRPVLLLTGRQTWSSAESFVSAMRELPHVIVVGDTTGGGSGNPSVFPLREGYGYSVSRWIEYTADRAPIEWRGIAPDVAVPFTEAALQRGEDETLAYAQGAALGTGALGTGALGAGALRAIPAMAR